MKLYIYSEFSTKNEQKLNILPYNRARDYLLNNQLIKFKQLYYLSNFHGFSLTKQLLIAPNSLPIIFLL